VTAEWTPECDRLLHYLYAHTFFATTLRAALDREQQFPGLAWRWQDVRETPRNLNRMVLDGVLDKTQGGYATHAHDDLARAVARFLFERASAGTSAATARAAGGEPPVPPGLPSDLFDQIIGYPEVKRQLLLALNARDRIHVLLWGPPSTAKSLFMEALERIPGAKLRFGDQISKAGLRDLLLNDRPEVLIIDEIDKLAPVDDTVLLEVMERGTISVLHYGEDRSEPAPIRVFAAANRVEKMRKELLSRFDRIKLREYTADEFRDVARHYLEKRGTEASLARLISDGVAGRSRDIRDARRIASMAYTVADVQFLLARLGQEANV
jgi:hypothetical protein